jgi:two-component system alkaline phosphatase synthesis response regulator PhoP
MAKTILVVDDEAAIVKLVTYHLEKEGYSVIAAQDGDEALAHVRNNARIDLILLDVMLPGTDGLEVCRRLRMEGNHTPIIFLTARDEEIDKVLGLDFGADDYVTKPFSPRELLSRIRAVLRRMHVRESAPPREIRIRDLTIIPEEYKVVMNGKAVELTAREFEVLAFLAQHPGRVFTRDALLDHVWGYDFAGDTRIVDVTISHLRDKLEKNSKSPEYIKTVRGVGYKLSGAEP